MTTLKFRVFWEEDDTIYRDISILPNQTFFDLFKCILSSYGFDDKHKATFYRSNDNWQRGREITLEKYDKDYKVEPMLMQEALISSEIKEPPKPSEEPAQVQMMVTRDMMQQLQL